MSTFSKFTNRTVGEGANIHRIGPMLFLQMSVQDIETANVAKVSLPNFANTFDADLKSVNSSTPALITASAVLWILFMVSSQ